eukprot:CAMPEP_0178439970 /NCGR_PEP_ID=MMETSP0689_2-20121128/36483_1 /TAXON_ID=160604 /ORGANISM="Amphidinium massartii, Strain CS-259" /LENGTH=108 /DNA_ID=CAMNT_0020062621 /DNA_START=38 /DNA_END=364 /DNA_ORIENTATION=+
MSSARSASICSSSGSSEWSSGDSESELSWDSDFEPAPKSASQALAALLRVPLRDCSGTGSKSAFRGSRTLSSASAVPMLPTFPTCAETADELNAGWHQSTSSGLVEEE